MVVMLVAPNSSNESAFKLAVVLFSHVPASNNVLPSISNAEPPASLKMLYLKVAAPFEYVLVFSHQIGDESVVLIGHRCVRLPLYIVRADFRHLVEVID